MRQRAAAALEAVETPMHLHPPAATQNTVLGIDSVQEEDVADMDEDIGQGAGAWGDAAGGLGNLRSMGKGGAGGDRAAGPPSAASLGATLHIDAGTVRLLFQ
jgi:hypothetical protein